MEINDDNHTSIDPVKTGNFIRELRVSHNWTQDELGSRLIISRKSVSKWETGKCCPSIDMLKRLSETLGVSFDDLLAGEFTEVEEPESAISKFINNKSVRITWKVAVTTAFIALLFFFIYNYNATKVYKLSYEDDNFVLDNGVIVISNAKNYINIGDFYTNFADITEDTDFRFVLYMYDGTNKIELLSQENNKTPVSLKDASKELFSKDNKNYLNNIFLNITFVNIYNEEKSYDIRLTTEVDFMNNFKYLFKYNKDNDLVEEDEVPIAYSRQSGSGYETKEFDLSFLYENYKKLVIGSTIDVNSKKYFVITENDILKIYNDEISIIFLSDIKKVNIFTDDYLFLDVEEKYVVKITSSEKKLKIIDEIFNYLKTQI